MADQIQNEADIRNRENKDGDSLAELKKMDNGVDIEPEADEWEAKPAPTAHPDPLPKK
ncbi:hypothetical protein SAMN04487895_11856 [Paenibacillus sophorae]|uniref:Uncharacterized protein n=1 Tax=Paenibacillus sophorae TaxID=1333845 RepID=A0A1H8UMF7_9BACL|nr:hypothetical protein [Paenibacillus sophorae]QWU13312.1 hypothetical protein KP014_14980 [Paenibacillus sophorae]SEP04405.1 hypothetical protein SAMN04487895_11856 [Paenibacillus sophorae]